mmetsp:Transcript_24061/g.28424  ORF Transcript_24061/g.28424 Transcript_24061/m.28424 type:complete len:107 (-) Transcript_24061:36-356(-)
MRLAMACAWWLRTASPLPHVVLCLGCLVVRFPTRVGTGIYFGVRFPTRVGTGPEGYREREVWWLLPTTSLLIALCGSPGMTSVVTDRLRFDSSSSWTGNALWFDSL